MPWMKLETITLDNDLEVHAELVDAFEPLYQTTESNTVGSAAALYRKVGAGVVTYYLSPLAAKLMAGRTRHNFTICGRPDVSGFDLLVGDSAARDPAWVELPDSEREPELFDPEIAEQQDAEWNISFGDEKPKDRF